MKMDLWRCLGIFRNSKKKKMKLDNVITRRRVSATRRGKIPEHSKKQFNVLFIMICRIINILQFINLFD